MRRRHVLGGALAAGALVVSGCHAEPTAPHDGTPAVPWPVGDTFGIGLEGYPTRIPCSFWTTFPLDLKYGLGFNLVAMAHSDAHWPEELASIGALRFARRSPHFEATVRFYRDLVGLPLRATFGDSFGSNGAIFGLPRSNLTFELVETPMPSRSIATISCVCISLTVRPSNKQRPSWWGREPEPVETPIPIGGDRSCHLPRSRW